MDSSSVFQSMLDKAIECEPLAFRNFDRTKNVQDQLQEMVKSKSPTDLIDMFLSATQADISENKGWDDWYPGDYWIQFSSMERLWLAFVMKEKYRKHWDKTKEEWVSSEA